MIMRLFRLMPTAEVARRLGLTEKQVKNYVYRENVEQWARKDAATLSRINSENEPCVVLKQPFIEPLRYATDAEIDDFLESHGYTVDMDDIWFDGRHEISDVKSSNVLVDLDGNYHFIDAVVNDIRYPIDKINKISIKHPGKRST
jgi:hypothetical protein